MPLATQSYVNADLADSETLMSLAWTADEAAFLQPGLQTALDTVLAEAKLHLATYAVTDPFGQTALSETVAGKFALDPRSFTIFCGAGVSGLLFSLAAALSGKAVDVAGDCYPDFPEWLSRFSASVQTGLHRRADAVFIERPGFLGESEFDGKAALSDLCRRSDAIVIVDESNANYLPDTESAAVLLRDRANLIVLRGLSKAYGMGGMRFGYAVCGARASAWARTVFPPLQNASLSVAMAREILALPADLCDRLRHQIRQAKDTFLRAATEMGFPKSVPVHDALPYVVYDPEDRNDHLDAVRELTQRGIVGKQHVLWSGRARHLYRYSVPLDGSRIERFRRLMDRASG
ncbi:aminotransferase class I/II-fold pyridoxal phosphate-dependent enzyme [Rhizobium johnstonii]|uniref:aminotransferase class I/II-fold pyridoxal phosphate-dependent enzyme n=1 Tax=Rhizobium johnstonii TaxID=3019933 RepID=UPI003F9A3FAC